MNSPIEQRCQGFNTLGQKYPISDNIQLKYETIETIDCYWFNKSALQTDSKLLIYIHGGCFTLGSIDSHQANGKSLTGKAQ